jgi:hypothetical protein
MSPDLDGGEDQQGGAEADADASKREVAGLLIPTMKRTVARTRVTRRAEAATACSDI